MDSIEEIVPFEKKTLFTIEGKLATTITTT